MSNKRKIRKMKKTLIILVHVISTILFKNDRNNFASFKFQNWILSKLIIL